VFIVFDRWKQLVITAYPCAGCSRFQQPDEDDGWISSWIQKKPALLRTNQIFQYFVII